MELALQISLASAQRSGQCISAINLDIDHFKEINDRYGHDGGDFVLRQIADILLNYSRPDDVCCRLGGEEFVIIMPGTSKENAGAVAERIRQNIEALELKYQRHKIRLTSSFGIATHFGEVQIDHLIKDADKALYAAKSEGRNRVCVTDTDNLERLS
jgi:diguanylate cyclase (GGDEF)-like protein